jgi:Flp pilus assembly protein TadG
MRPKQRGAAALEFALVLPLYLLVIDGVMEFSLLLYDQAIVLNAARAAVRAGVVVSAPKLADAAIATFAQVQAQTYLLSFDGAPAVTVVVEQTPGAAYQTPLTVSVGFTYNSLLAGSFLSAIQWPVVVSSRVTGMNE